MAILDAVLEEPITVTARKPALSAFDLKAALDVTRPEIETMKVPPRPKWWQKEGVADFLLASGAAMSGSDTFLRGISNGANAGVAAMREAEERNKPRFEFLNGGRVLAKFDPKTSTYEYIPIEAVNSQLAGDKTFESKLRREEAQEEFGRQTKRDETQHGYALKEIGAQGQNSERVARIGADASLKSAIIGATSRERTAENRSPSAKARAATAEKIYMEDFRKAQVAEEMDAQLDALEELIGRSGRAVGSDAVTTTLRNLSTVTGVDWMGVDVADSQAIEAVIKQMEVSASRQLAGQGQITENERKLLAATLPRISNDPAALKEVIRIIRAANNRAREAITGYDAASDIRGPNYLYTDYLTDRFRQRQAANEQPKNQSKTFKSGGTSVTVSSR